MAKEISIRSAGGLRAVLAPCEAESVAVGVFVASGSRHERPCEAGISHFIEHMLFKGTPSRKPIDITRAIEGRGGNFNAMTGEEATCYYAHLPSEYLAEAIDILSDMYLNSSIPDDEFEREKSVIIEEIRMYADEPDQVAAENLQKCVFPGSPLGSPVAGTPESLKPLKPEDLRRYIKGHYRADNSVVVIVGAFDEGEAERLLAKAFSPLASRGKAARARFRPSAPDAKRVVPHISEEKEINQAQLALGYRTFGISDPRKYAASVMDAILGRGMMSRLFQEVREKRGLSYDISSRMQFFSDTGMFTVSAGTDPARAAKTLETVEREMKRICEKRPGAAELKRTKEFLTGNFRLSHERVTSKLFFYGQTMLAFGRVIEPAEQVAGIEAVTAADVQAVAKAILRPSMRSVSWVVPKKGGAS